MTAGGLRFNEVMNGQIAFRQTDPVTGYRDPGAVAMSLYAFIDIEDMDRFFDTEKRRSADFAARVMIPVMGGQFLGEDGGFVLFELEDAPDSAAPPLRTMAYTTKLIRGEHRYEMRGRKYIRAGWPWGMWRATTTLHVTLHELPSDPAAAEVPGRIVAAGILRLSLGAFLSQMATMRVSGDAPLVPKAAIALRYYWFFVWSLTKSYLFHRNW